MSSDTKIVWTRKSKRTIDPVLIARRINRNWLTTSIDVVSIRFTGGLLSALSDLTDAASQTKKNLPISSLRIMLQTAIDGVISVDRNLGCDSGRPSVAAIEMYRPPESDDFVIAQVCEQIRYWCMDTLEAWAKTEGLDEIAVRVKKATIPEHVAVTGSSRSLREGENKGPDFALIARLVGDRLAGETLFSGMGPCELILSEFATSNTTELMTPPRRSSAKGNVMFSMVAKVTISTVPYSTDVYLSVAAAKRVWSERKPSGGNTGKRATAYVIAPNRSSIPVTIGLSKNDDGWTWEFNDEYASLNRESAWTLPPTLDGVINNVAYTDGQWWAGLPQTTRLFNRVAPHTVLEGDEIELLSTVEPLLVGIIDSDVPFLPCPLSLNSRPLSAMLKSADFGAAGIALEDLDDTEEEDVEILEEVETGAGERQEVAKFREQCIRVLSAVHGDKKPCLWIVGGTSQEQEFIAKTSEFLFGDAVITQKDPLPADVHGLKANLPGKDFKTRPRFALRVDAWKKSELPAAISEYDGPKFVLICAAKDVQGRPEDSVNRRAAIHAMCSIAGASVHHVLPIEAAGTDARIAKANQSFIHRVQSAMMDVLLAHSGYVIGTKEFVDGKLAEANRPKAIYGIQALRKKAQRFSGEQAVCMVIYSRLMIESGVTEISFCYQENNRTQRSPWMKLSSGLIWLGTQRQIQGDEKWLRQEFEGVTTKAFSDIQTDDPRAVVFIDWETTRGLWRGINDVNLTASGTPKIGHLDMATAFPLMSFVRLRYGWAAPMALRGWSKTVYEGWRDENSRIATGEFFTDEYATTVKQLIEINPAPTARNHSHFIGVMSYRKTSQVKRGKSCYRATVRMTRPEESKKGVFDKVTFDPADMDASLPSTMDITVMTTPKGVTPDVVASLAMGLRLGYAHYDEWTLLPAPLFFQRKIDDYIIKYPVSDDDSNGVEPVEADDLSEPSETSIAATPLMQMVTEIVEQKVASYAPLRQVEIEFSETAPESEPDIDELPPPSEAIRSEDVMGADEGLLARARRVQMLSFYPPQDPKCRLMFEAMLRNEIHIHVDVPYFVKLKGLFGKYDPALKKRISRAWKQLREFGYVAKTKPCPSNDAFLDWLAGHLAHPQGAYLINPIMIFGREIIVPKVFEAVVRYNAVSDEKVAVRTRDGSPNLDLTAVTQKAIAEKDDATLAWLIFAAAQTPSFGCAESILSNVTEILGSKTEAALHYYLDCAAACDEAFEQRNSIRPGQFAPIHKVSTFVPPTERADEIAPVAPPILATAPAEPLETDSVMLMKSDLHALIDAINPGADGFSKTIEDISALLDSLRLLDEAQRQKAEAETSLKQREAALQSRAVEIIASIGTLDEESAIGPVVYLPALADTLDAAADEMKTLSDWIALVGEQKSLLEGFYETQLPATASMAERSRRNREEGALLSTMSERFAGLSNALMSSVFFCCISDSPPPDDTPPDRHDDSTDVAPDAAPSTQAPTPEEVAPAVQAELIPDTLVSPDVTCAPSEAVVPAVEDAVTPEIEATVPLSGVVPDVVVAARPVQNGTPATVAPPATVTEQVKATVVQSRKVEVSQALERLLEIIDRRHYSLASVYVNAIKVAFADAKIDSHAIILNALCDAMGSIDCRFAVDTRLDQDLRERLQKTTTMDADAFSGNIGWSIGVLAGSLVSMIFSAQSADTDIRWTVIDRIQQPLTGLHGLSTLVAHIGSMDNKGIILTRDKFSVSRVGDKLAVEAELQRYSDRALNWKKDHSIHSSWNHHGFSRMHDDIYGPRHAIGQCLTWIAKGDVKHLRQAYDAARRKFEKPAVTVAESFKKIGEKSKPDGRFHTFACENITTTHRFVEAYLQHVDGRINEKTALDRNDQAFLDSLHSCLTAAINDLNGFRPEHVLDCIYAQTALVVFNAVLRLFDETPPAYCVPEPQQRLLIQLPMDKEFMPSMSASEETGVSALCSAEDVIQSINDLMQDDLTNDRGMVEADLQPLLIDALKYHVEERRFLPAFAIESFLPKERLRNNFPFFAIPIGHNR
ncbi:RNaseH domain-containing protein, partial [Propionivibrio sp.]|uniref:RNaseH domain-containing protein n=1 Tax=Propionivibrio sp. TaxID=2212460 RepID=UPI003BF2F081